MWFGILAWFLGSSFRFNFWVLAFYLSAWLLAWLLGFVTAARVFAYFLLIFCEIFCEIFCSFFTSSLKFNEIKHILSRGEVWEF